MGCLVRARGGPPVGGGRARELGKAVGEYRAGDFVDHIRARWSRGTNARARAYMVKGLWGGKISPSKYISGGKKSTIRAG